ncbi:MAG: hypothetical protein Q9168_005356 [Polycauliona sp. 1 TL-2023]
MSSAKMHDSQDIAVEMRTMGLDHDNDENNMARLGKVPVLKRNFGFMSILGFSCTVLVTWEGFLKNNLNASGPMSCWFTVLGWQAFVASVGYLNGTMLQGLIILTNPSYAPKPWQNVLLYWAVILGAVTFNAAASSWLPKFEGLILILHIFGFFGILFPLVILGPHAPASEVFQTFINGGNWPTNGLSFFVGLLGNVFAFFGADGAIHMAEEIQNAAVVVPRAIVLSIFLNGTLGLGMALALLFCVGDIDAALNTATGFPFMEIFYQAVQNLPGAAIMVSLVIFLSLCAAIGQAASASRQLWAFSRDRAVPGWRYLQRVDAKSAVPILAIGVTTIIPSLLALIILGSSTAFNDIVSLAVVGLFGSYFVVAVLLLWRRIRGDIEPYTKGSDRGLTNVPGARLAWGPWRVPGLFGVVNNGVAVIYLLIIIFFCLWPPSNHPTAKTMNYSSLMLGATMLFSVVYYFAWARKVYTGPVVQISP